MEIDLSRIQEIMESQNFYKSTDILLDFHGTFKEFFSIVSSMITELFRIHRTFIQNSVWSKALSVLLTI